MPKLSDLNIGRCRECGKLFKQEPQKEHCRRCSGVEVPEDFRVPPPPLAVLPEPEADAEAEENPVCIRCNKRDTVEGSDFCLSCNLDLYRSLGEAANTLFPKLEVMTSASPRTESTVFASYMQKRARTATSRISMVRRLK